MKFYLKSFIILLFAAVSFKNLNAQQQFFGNWKGALLINGMKLDIFFHFLPSTTSDIKGNIDVPLQKLKRFPIDDITIKSKTRILCTFGSINADFSGKLTDTNKLTGEWKQNGKSLPLDLIKYYGSSEIIKNQTPRPPFPYKVEQVSFSNEDGKIRFGGSLTIPDTFKFKGKRPGVILFTGSGSQDRDESIGNHKPFAVIAHTLTQSGFVVLRVDDRNVGSTKCSPEKLEYTTNDLADDGVSFVKFLNSQKTIDTSRIFLVGHSEGGSVAVKTALKIPGIRGIVGLAPMIDNGLETNVFQNIYSLESMGFDSVKIAAYIDLHRRIVSAGLSLSDTAKDSEFKSIVINEIKSWEHRFPRKITKKIEKSFAKKLKTPFQVDYIYQVYSDLTTNHWFRYFLKLDPSKDLEKLNCPMLVIQGAKDHQINAKASKRIIQELQDKGKLNIYYSESPELNHLLQTCKTGLVSEYFDNEETISLWALKTLNDWLKNQCN